jgi:hypothetical protein
VLATSESVVCEVTEADEGASPDSSDDDDLSNLAAKIVALNGAKFSSRCCLKEFNCKFEEINERFWTTCTTSESFKCGTCRSYSTNVPLGNLA